LGSNRFRNVGLFFLLALIWGSSFPAIEVGLEALSPLLFAALRYDIASLVLFGYALSRGYRSWPAGRAEWGLIVTGGTLVIGLHFALAFVGQTYVTSAIGAVVLSLVPVLTPAFALVVLDARLSPPEIGGFVVGLLGVCVVANPGSGLDGQLIGVSLFLLAAICFAVGSVLTVRFDATLPIATSQAWMTLVGASVLHLLSAGFEGSPAAVLGGVPSVEALVALVYLAVVASAAGFLLYFSLVGEIGPSQASLVSYITPIVAAVGGWVAFGEPITRTTVVGFCVIAAGFALIELRPLHGLLTRRRRHAIARRYADSHTIAVAGNRYYK